MWANPNATASIEEGGVISFLPVLPVSDAYNRRCFLVTAVETVAGVTLTGWALAVRAAPGQPATGAGGLTVIDTHIHFYDPSRPQGVPWPPRDEKLLYRTVLPKTYRALPVPKPVTGTVVVEAICAGHCRGLF